MKINTLYKRLLKEYGPQGWWPVTRTDHPEYFPGSYDHPRNGKEAWEIMVGAILTQNTAWKNVEKALKNLIKAQCLDMKCIAGMPKQELAELIRPAGYYNQKADRLKVLARYMLDKWGGNLNRFFSRHILEIREELLSIKGIGRETADSIILYAGKKPIFVVDAYTRRIFYRLGVISSERERYDRIREMVEKEFSDLGSEQKRVVFNEFHALMVEHAKQHCRKRPSCENCPVRRECRFKP